MRSLLPLLALSACLPRIDEKNDGCPAIAVDPAGLDWTDVRLGQSGTATLVVTNACSGDGTLEISSLTVDGGAFAVEGGAPGPLAPGESADLTVTYTPDDGTADAGTLTLTSNDAATPTLDVALSGTPIVDADGDGYYADEDCDDTEATAYPGGEETWYDGIDGDCDGASDYDQDADGADAAEYGGADCDDVDPDIGPGNAEVWYDGVDQDCSGGSDYDQDADGYEASAYGGDDCDDEDPAAHPGATEVWYDGVDQACDGGDDYDQDGDGYTAIEEGGDDCDDLDPTSWPGAPEVWYDGVDEDCAGGDDYDQDADGDPSDAYGGGDCQDGVAGISSLATETWYDGLDQDCAGDDDYDQDHDAYRVDVDCDDTDAAIHPGAADAWYDGLDQDCAGNDDYDQDADGDPASAYGGGDCADTLPTVSSLATETWYDGIDQDCAGDDDYDQDADGHQVEPTGDDCDDTDGSAWPGAPEVWYDGVDQDCAGDDDYDQDADGHPVYPTGDDCDDTDPVRTTGTTEVRNGVDDDCDGQVDEGVSAWGDLLVTEVMANPSRVVDTYGEWIELYNPGAWDIDLSGWRLGAPDGNSATVSSSVVVPAGGYAVLGVDADTARNGGVSLDYPYPAASFSLTDAGDTVAVYSPEGTLVAQVTWARGWPVTSGASLSLDPYFYDPTDAAAVGSWCAATSTYGAGDHGTPGAENDVCTDVDHDGDGETTAEGDCDDFDPTVYSTATEIADGIDQDCDGMVDEVTAPVSGEPYLDGTSSYWNLYVNGFADAERDGVVDVFYVAQNTDYLYTAPTTNWTSWAGNHNTYGSQEIPALVTSLVSCCNYSASVVDLTGDSDADYIVSGTTASYTAIVNVFRGPVAGHSSGGDYDMQVSATTGSSRYAGIVTGADFNGDGTSELVVAGVQATWSGRSNAGYVGIYDLVGAYGTVSRDAADQLYYGGSANELVGEDIAADDWNGDGYADLAIAGASTIWLVDGDGFASSGSTAVSSAADATITWSGATDISVALLDDVGDGTRSLIGASDTLRRWADAGSLSGALSADAADGILTNGSGWAPTLGPDGADVDGDGVDELLFSSDGTLLTMLYAYGATDWPAGTSTIGTGALTWEIANTGAVWGPAYDLDGDGDEEVVLSHLGYSTTGRTWFLSF